MVVLLLCAHSQHYCCIGMLRYYNHHMYYYLEISCPLYWLFHNSGGLQHVLLFPDTPIVQFRCSIPLFLLTKKHGSSVIEQPSLHMTPHTFLKYQKFTGSLRRNVQAHWPDWSKINVHILQALHLKHRTVCCLEMLTNCYILTRNCNNLTEVIVS